MDTQPSSVSIGFSVHSLGHNEHMYVGCTQIGNNILKNVDVVSECGQYILPGEEPAVSSEEAPGGGGANEFHHPFSVGRTKKWFIAPALSWRKIGCEIRLPARSLRGGRSFSEGINSSTPPGGQNT